MANGMSSSSPAGLIGAPSLLLGFRPFVITACALMFFLSFPFSRTGGRAGADVVVAEWDRDGELLPTIGAAEIYRSGM